MSSHSWIAIAGLSAALVPQAQAADPTGDDLPIINMDTVVVTATQTEEDAFRTAKSIDKVDQEQLDIQQPESPAEAVEELTNVNVTQGPRQVSQQVNIRGLAGKEVLQVLDNARQNFQNGHQGSFFVEPELLKEIEVLRGPGSSLWGSGAIGGVVNMTTVDPGDLLREDQRAGAKIKGGIGTADDLLFTSDTVYGRVDENNEVLANFTYRNTHDIEAGDHQTIPNSAYWDRSGMAKWVTKFANHQSLKLSYVAFDAYQDVPSDPRQDSDGSENPLVNQNIYQQNWNATYRWADPSNDLFDVTSTLYYNDTEVTDDCLGECSTAAGGPDRDDFTQYQTTGWNIRNSSYLNLGTLTYGGEVYHDQTTGERNGEDRAQFPDAHTDVWATYIQAEVPFWEVWTLTPGIRYDHFYNNPDADFIEIGKPPVSESISSTSEGDISTAITLGWETTKWLSLYAIYDEAFRAPAIDELYPSGYHFGFGPILNEFAPNPDLKPEKSRNKELSARMGWTNLLKNCEDELRIRLSVFRNDVQNLIQQQIQQTGPTTSVTIYENVPNARLTGFESDATYRIKEWYASLGYGYVKGINEDPIDSEFFDQQQTEYLDDIPPERIIFNVGRYFYENTFLSGFRLTHAWAQDKVSQPQNCDPDSDVPANACPIPGYTTLDWYAAWQPDSGEWENFRVDLTVNNITDQYYYQSTSSLLPEEGTDVRVSVSYTF